MEECKSTPVVHDVEEGEISDSASSVEEISEEAFNKKDPPPPSASAAPAPPASGTDNILINNINHNNNQQHKPRVWTMRDLYKYQLSRNYSAGLHNLAWASAVQNKPLDEVLEMEFPKPTADNNGGNSSLKRAGSEGQLTTNDANKEAGTEAVTGDNEGKKDETEAAGEGLGEEEKEEGELEEGEIDLDSDMVIEINGDVSKETDKEAHLDQSVDLLRKGLESVTAEEAEKSFDEVSSRTQNLLDSMRQMDERNLLTAKDVIVRLSFTAIKTLNTVFCSMDRDHKEYCQEIMSRLLTHASNQLRPLFSAEHLKEIDDMISSLESSPISLHSKDAHRKEEIKELKVLAKSDFDLSSRIVKKVSTNILDMNTIPVESSDQPEIQISQKNTKLANSKYRGLSIPLLDLHKDHDADSLPSPTRGGPSCLPGEKGFLVGHGLLKPEWPVPRVVLDRESVPMHPYETDAVKAVSSYQQKFGRSSFLMNERLPSPTPSEDGDTGDGDLSGEVSSSSSNMNVNPVSALMVGQSTVSSAPKMDIPSGQGLKNVWNAPTSTYGSNPSVKSSVAKSRDPRLRLANSDAASSNRLLPVVNHEHKVEPVGGMINSRKQKTAEDLVDGPILKRQRSEQAEILNDVQAVTGAVGWLEDREGTVGLGGTNKNHELKSNVNDPRRMPELAVAGVSSSSNIIKLNENLAATTPSATASLHSILKDIVVNPSIWMNIIKMEQQKSANPAQTTTLATASNSINGAIPSTNVVASKSPVLGEKAAGMLQMASQTSSVEELGKVRMKLRDPRRVLQSSTALKGESVELGQSFTKSSTSSSLGIVGNVNFHRQDDQLDKKGTPSHSVAPPDIARQFTTNLKNIADIVSVSQPTSSQPIVPKLSSSLPVQAHQVRTDAAAILESSNSQTVPDLDCKVSSSSSQPQNNWDDVQHLFEGFDDHQKAAIHRERARRMEEQRKMFAGRKLCLVLDLDHTLLNSAKFAEVDSVHDEMLRKKEEQDREKSQRHLFRFPHMGMWTKLRPGIWNFLEKASKLYELHLYTMGNKLYATEMAKLLDPKGELFAGRVISRGDDGDLIDGDERIPKSKDLEGVMGMESAVVIVDDSMRVWPHNKLNLIVVERYIYFPCSRRQFGLPGPSLLEIDHDERPEDGTLASSLAVIERIHQIFFAHQSLDEADVRNILALEQRKILGGCRIMFSRVFPVGEANPHLHPLWQTAEQFGAVCTNSIDEQVTHVVANSLGTDKVNWALSKGRFVVHPGWVEASALLYRRASEQDFAIKQ